MGEKFGELTLSNIWRTKVLGINRSANRLLIVSTNLDGFSFSESRMIRQIHQTFLLYNIN